MPRRSPAQRAVIMLAFTGVLPLLVLGCPKKPPPPPPEAPPAAPAAEVDSGPTVLTPLDDDAGDAAEAAAPKHYGKPVNNNTMAIKQCCGALRTQAKALGTSPEGNMLISLSVQCETFALAATTGNAPEFAQIRAMLKGKSLPAACQAIK